MGDVALIGQAGVGKSTLAKLLVYRNGYARMSIADPIKALVHQAFPGLNKTDVVPGLTSYGQPMTVRQLLQRVGAIGREAHPDLWLKIWATRRDGLAGRAVVTDDLRLVREVHYLRAYRPGTLIVLLHADPSELASRAGEVPTDETELQPLMADYDLKLNTSQLTPDQVYAAVVEALRAKGE